MTTDPTADLRALLDGLEQAREKATPGPWRVGGSGVVAGLEYVAQGIRTDADAACIVAEHNRVPDLIAAVRGALDLADELDTDDLDLPWLVLHRLPRRDAWVRSRQAANHLRAVLAAALTGGAQ